MRTPIKKVRILLPAVLALGAIAAGCGGGSGYSSGGSRSGPPATGGAQRSGPAAPAAAANKGIPQHNGGDMDADNNGGPSDGDGNQ